MIIFAIFIMKLCKFYIRLSASLYFFLSRYAYIYKESFLVVVDIHRPYQASYSVLGVSPKINYVVLCVTF